VKIRDNICDFLNQIQNLFEIYIFTLGTKLYAEKMIKIIKNKFFEKFSVEANFLNYQRIISRELI
jgi:TFIIF-interacting CTD phosphatase-like protein